MLAILKLYGLLYIDKKNTNKPEKQSYFCFIVQTTMKHTVVDAMVAEIQKQTYVRGET